MFPFSSFKVAILFSFLDDLNTNKYFVYLQVLANRTSRKNKNLGSHFIYCCWGICRGVKEDVFYFVKKFFSHHILYCSCLGLEKTSTPVELPVDTLTYESHPALSVALWVTARVSHQPLSGLRSLEWGLCATFLVWITLCLLHLQTNERRSDSFSQWGFFNHCCLI